MRDLNTFPECGHGRRWLLRSTTAGLAAVCFALSVFAVDANRLMSQYIRNSWGTESGFPGGSVSSIAQTPDGYLWIGTDKGLVRFDGLNFRQFEQATPISFTIGPVQTLLTDAQGNLWILLQNTKLLRYRDGKFDVSRGEAENGITAIGQGKAGEILLSSLALGTLAYNGDRFLTLSSAALFADTADAAHGETPDQRSSRLSWTAGVMPDRLAGPTSSAISIATTTDGKIWLGTQDRGLFYLQQGRVSAAANVLLNSKINCLLPLENRELWIGTSKGVWRWNGTELTRAGVPSSLLHVEALAMIRDRDSNIWVGTTHGLLRFNVNGVSSLAREAPATSGPVTAIFEDREGNLWIGGARGLERLRDSAFVTYSVAGLQSQSMGAVFVDSEDKTWFAPNEGGLRWRKGGNGGAVTAAGLGQDIVYSIASGGNNELWVGRQRGGLTLLRLAHDSFTAKTYTQADGLAQDSVYAVYEDRDRTVWSGTLNAGVSELRNGHFTTYTKANGLASNTVSSIAEGADGTMWFGTPNGLSGLTKNGWRTYTVRDGLSSQEVNCLLRDSTGILWIGTAEGLAILTAGHIQVPRRVPDSLREPVFGVAEDRYGSLWVATASHVLQAKRSSLMGDLLQETDFHEYGLADGLPSTEGVKRYQSVVADSHGQVWFSTNRGLSVVNPARPTVDPAPALVSLEAVLADGSPLDLRGPVRVSSARQRTTFRYVGLSLGNSGRVRYRYRLDAFDHGWSEATTNREATYANLGAGSYRFRVMASNSDGLWNGSEAAVVFEVEPTLWQTWWFRISGVLVIVLATLLFFRLRVLRLTSQMNMRFEERLKERTRIAQELHDTLLQGFLSASMLLHVADDQLPLDSAAKPLVTRVLELMGRVIEEGRNAVQGLRMPNRETEDLEQAFARIQQEIDVPGGSSLRVVVEGIAQPLRPAIREEVYRIGREALVNALRHSHASSVELELEYAREHLRLLVRDNGTGIDPQVVHAGRAGHWGLSGMRERAERIGAKLRVLSGASAGTEIELSLPGQIAFESPASESRWGWLGKLHLGRVRNEEPKAGSERPE